jgi:hypothetical protein
LKLQFWSIDLVFAIVIFSGAIILLSVVWVSINSQFSSSYGFSIGIMQLQLNSLLQRLQSQGSPANWDSFVAANSTGTWSNISVGLESSTGGGTLSRNKVFALLGMANTNYQATKQLLGVGYDYYITISSQTVQNQYNISIGLNPATRNATAIQTATVPVIFDNGQSGVMRVIVWTNTTFGVG